MHVTAKADYALRAVIELALHEGTMVTRERIAAEQEIPAKYLEAILAQLTRSGILAARRGVNGGYVLGRTPAEISVADVIRAVDGPLAGVRGQRPEDVDYPASTTALREVWIAARASLRAVLEATTVDEIAHKALSDEVVELLHGPGAWERR
ncbi:Rrf2 family transcriptional regulator [Arthrobacter sp. BF1]|uniref:RrF2 family transcriptional regulator n=1 Tax=Arthrobacter sp. BF1 TaxID=2821145 RepID=UPI001C4E7DF6|nr:Rrf2 family transcriptional regulator [Arthrobacter sp. BF1]